MKIIFVNFEKKHVVFFAFIFLVSISLRLGLTIYNREANDPHIKVIRYILREKSLPEKTDCWECFQPKLFHYTTAKILGILRLDKNRDADSQKIAVQIINFISGVVILIVSWIFISSLTNIPAWIRILGFALLAFNPQMIGINSQVTNDTFLIMFSVIAVHEAYLFLRGGNLAHFLLVSFFSFLAVITKTNGWVVVISIALAFFCKVLFEPRSRFSKMHLLTSIYPLLVAVLAVSSPLSQYINNYQHYGSPYLINIERQPRPLFFTETYTPYAGILSIQDGFFTFKFTDLLKKPITNLEDRVDKSTHRTSLWTRLYASANSVHFENYPPSWRETGGSANQASFAVYRGIFILALLPTLIMLIGAAAEIYETFISIMTKNMERLCNASYGLFAVLFAGYIFFSILYAFEYRIYTVMKAVFIYPGLLAFVVFFLKGAHLIFHHAKIKKLAEGLIIWISILLFLYVFDVVPLIIHLLPNQSGFTVIMESIMRSWR